MTDDRDQVEPEQVRQCRYRSKDHQIMVLLASGLSERDVADQAGVSDRTVRRRLNKPDFAARLAATRREMFNAAVGGISSQLGTAVDTIVQIATDPDVSSNTRLKAAQMLLVAGHQHIATEAVAEQLRVLESRLDHSLLLLEEDSDDHP